MAHVVLSLFSIHRLSDETAWCGELRRFLFDGTLFFVRELRGFVASGLGMREHDRTTRYPALHAEHGRVGRTMALRRPSANAVGGAVGDHGTKSQPIVFGDDEDLDFFSELHGVITHTTRTHNFHAARRCCH